MDKSNSKVGSYDLENHSANDVFKRMVVSDIKQNQKIASRLSLTSYGLGSEDKESGTRTRMRFVVCILGLMALTTSQMSRMVLNLTITQMVDPSMLAKGTSNSKVPVDGSCPWPENVNLATPKPTTTTTMPTSSSPSTRMSTTEDHLAIKTRSSNWSPTAGMTTESTPRANPTTLTLSSSTTSQSNGPTTSMTPSSLASSDWIKTTTTQSPTARMTQAPALATENPLLASSRASNPRSTPLDDPTTIQSSSTTTSTGPATSSSQITASTFVTPPSFASTSDRIITTTTTTSTFGIPPTQKPTTESLLPTFSRAITPKSISSENSTILSNPTTIAAVSIEQAYLSPSTITSTPATRTSVASTTDQIMTTKYAITTTASITTSSTAKSTPIVTLTTSAPKSTTSTTWDSEEKVMNPTTATTSTKTSTSTYRPRVQPTTDSLRSTSSVLSTKFFTFVTTKSPSEPYTRELSPTQLSTEIPMEFENRRSRSTTKSWNENPSTRRNSRRSPPKSSFQELETGESSKSSDTNSISAANESPTLGSPVATYEDKFCWTMRQQSVLLGGFYYSYFVFMILGGRLAEVYGSKYVLLLSVAMSGIINLLTPWMARTSFPLLVGSRVLMGAIQSGVFPGIYALFAKWLTMSEASIFAPLIKVNLRLGMMLGSFIPGLLPNWPGVFYFTGFVCILWSVLWIIFAQSEPKESSFVSAAELAHIMKKKRKPDEDEQANGIELSDCNGKSEPTKKTETKSLKTPWLKIITSPSVIGLIIVKITFNYAIDFLVILLPTYLKYVHHATKEQISTISTSIFLSQVILVVFVGWLAKYMVKNRPFGLSKTGVRKAFQGLASYGMGIMCILSSFNNCNLLLLAVFLQIISLLSMFSAGGETMLPYDLSDEYPATIMAIANSVANLSGVTTTILAAAILGEHGASYSRWNILLYMVGGANILGGLAFSLLVKAEPIDFGGKKREQKHKDLEDGHNVPAEDQVMPKSYRPIDVEGHQANVKSGAVERRKND